MEVGTMKTFPLLDETPVGAVRQQSRMQAVIMQFELILQ